MNLKKIFPRWDRTDETESCPTCGNVKTVKRARGITRQNIGRLFHPKWTVDETIITFLLIMILVMAIFYKIDIQQARDFIKDFNANPEKYCGNRTIIRPKGYLYTNITQNIMWNAGDICYNKSAS